MTTKPPSFNTPASDTWPDDSHGPFERIARALAAQAASGDAGQVIPGFAASRGIVAPTLKRWSIGYMSREAHELRLVEERSCR